MNNLKIALVRPNYNSDVITPPLGLGYISSYLKSKGYSSKIIDGLNLEYSAQKIMDCCKGADIVGISCMSAYFKEVISLSNLLKKNGFIVVIGGTHASALPDLTLKETSADYVIIGEGEYSLFELAKNIEDNKYETEIPGVVSRLTTKINRSPLIDNIDTLPYPDWEQIDPRAYKRVHHGGLIRNWPIAPIISTRGCPFECTFCASPFLWNRTIRFRNPESVVDEIEFLVNNFKVREIHFEDDNLTLKRQHIESICNLILKRRIRVNWGTPNGIRAETLDLELLKLMKKSGCYFIAIGIESGNQEILGKVKKKIDLVTVEKIVKLSKRIGLITQGFFIFGLPGDTKETIQKSINFAKSIPLDRAQFLMLDILPGSELWDKLSSSCEIKWNHKSYREAIWIPEGLNREELNHSLENAFKSFFLRPKQILFLLKYIHINQLPFVFKRLADFNIIPFLKHLNTKTEIWENNHFLTICVFSFFFIIMSGCAIPKKIAENISGNYLNGLSRDSADCHGQVFDYDINECFQKTLALLKNNSVISATILKIDKKNYSILALVSRGAMKDAVESMFDANSADVGIFLTQKEPGKTKVAIRSLSSLFCDYTAVKIFPALHEAK